MLKLLLLFLAWAGLGSLVYFYISPLALVIYGVVSIVAFLVWAVTRKRPNLNNRP